MTVEKKVIIKYVVIFGIILAFAGIIFGVSKIFANNCPSGSTWYDGIKKCMPNCGEDQQYDRSQNPWKCIPICAKNKDYYSKNNICLECANYDKNGERSEGVSGDYMRHPTCDTLPGDKSCGPNCAKRKKIDPSGKGGTVPSNAGQYFDCTSEKCVCETKGYAICNLTKDQAGTGVCFDPGVATCVCVGNTCTVKPCPSESICNTANGSQCCDTGKTCCNIKSGLYQCCKKGNCIQVSGAQSENLCCEDNQIPISGGDDSQCCNPQNVYCSDGGPPTNKDGTLSCASGGKLSCCGHQLCYDNNKLTCCADEKLVGESGCGAPSICMSSSRPKMAKNSPLAGKCLGVVLNNNDCGDSKNNCFKNICVNPADILGSSFSSPDSTTKKCKNTAENPRAVTYSSILNKGGTCAGDTDCAMSYGVSKNCYDYTNGKWDFTRSVQCTTQAQASGGVCLTGCGGLNEKCKNQIWCPAAANVACVCDVKNNFTMCKDAPTSFTKAQTWPPPKVIDNKTLPLWGQVYYPPAKDKVTHCPLMRIECDHTDKLNQCPNYKTLDGGDKQMDCVLAENSTYLCRPPVEKDIDDLSFCRVNYETDGNTIAAETSFLGDPVYIQKNNNDQPDVKTCSTNNWDESRCWPGCCGHPDTRFSFPFYSASANGYKGPMEKTDGNKEGTMGKNSWSCTTSDGIGCKVATGGPQGSAASPSLGTIQQAGVDSLNKYEWQPYHVKNWTTTSESSLANCYQQALSEVGDSSNLLLARVAWDDNTDANGGTCTAEYNPSTTPADKLCFDVGNPPESCVSNRKDIYTKDYIPSGLVCGNPNQKNPRPIMIGLTVDPTLPSTPGTSVNGPYACTTNPLTPS